MSGFSNGESLSLLKERACVFVFIWVLMLSFSGCYSYEAPDQSGENVVKLKRLMDRYNFGQYETVLPLAISHLKKFPESRRASTIIGFSYLHLGKAEKAEDFFNKQVDKWPDWQDGLLGLGRLARRQGNYRTAREYYEKVIGVNQQNSKAFTGLVVLDLCEGKFQDAKTNAEKAIEFSPNNAEYHANLAIANYYTGDVEEAKKAMKKAADLKYKKLEIVQQILSGQSNPFPVKR